MMGRSHALTGAAGWLAITGAYSLQTHTPVDPAALLLGTAVCAGAALAPDIDNNSSTVVSSLGFVGRGLHTLVNAVSVAFYNITKSRKDELKTNGHRTLFHTTIAAVLAGVLTFFLTLSKSHAFTVGGHDFTAGQVSSLIIMAVLLDLALGGLFQKFATRTRGKYGPYVLLAASLLGTLVLAIFLPEHGSYAWLGLAVGVGWFIHILGDLITKNGVPLVAPLRWRGRGWYDVALPGPLRIQAGGPFETHIITPAFGFIIVPGLFILDVLLYAHAFGG